MNNQKGSNSDQSDDEEEEGEGGWGSRKEYYGNDEDEDELELEKVVLEMQKKQTQSLDLVDFQDDFIKWKPTTVAAAAVKEIGQEKVKVRGDSKLVFYTNEYKKYHEMDIELQGQVCFVKELYLVNMGFYFLLVLQNQVLDGHPVLERLEVLRELLEVCLEIVGVEQGSESGGGSEQGSGFGFEFVEKEKQVDSDQDSEQDSEQESQVEFLEQESEQESEKITDFVFEEYEPIQPKKQSRSNPSMVEDVEMDPYDIQDKIVKKQSLQFHVNRINKVFRMIM